MGDELGPEHICLKKKIKMDTENPSSQLQNF